MGIFYNLAVVTNNSNKLLKAMTYSDFTTVEDPFPLAACLLEFLCFTVQHFVTIICVLEMCGSVLTSIIYSLKPVILSGSDICTRSSRYSVILNLRVKHDNMVSYYTKLGCF